MNSRKLFEDEAEEVDLGNHIHPHLIYTLDYNPGYGNTGNETSYYGGGAAAGQQQPPAYGGGYGQDNNYSGFENTQ